MAFQVLPYLAVDRETRLKDGSNAYANRGQILYPIGAIIPVIRTSPQRCIGTAYIKSIKMTENLTEVEFAFKSLDHASDVARAYLALYLNAVPKDDADPYSGEGVFIPGAMGIGSDTLREPRPKKETKERRIRSLTSMMDDDDEY